MQQVDDASDAPVPVREGMDALELMMNDLRRHERISGSSVDSLSSLMNRSNSATLLSISAGS